MDLEDFAIPSSVRIDPSNTLSSNPLAHLLTIKQILSTTAAQNSNLSILETLPNEVLTNILQNVTVIDQICVAVCSRELGAAVVALCRLMQDATNKFATSDCKVNNMIGRKINGSVTGVSADRHDLGEGDDGADDIESNSGSESKDVASWLTRSKSPATYTAHSRKAKATLKMLRRLLGWAPKSLGICQRCVKYKPRAPEYWNRRMDVVASLMTLQQLKKVVDAELNLLGPIFRDSSGCFNHYTFGWAYEELLSTKDVLDEVLGLDGSTDAVVRWSTASRSFEVIDCLVHQPPASMMCEKGFRVAAKPSERSILTVRKYARTCPECSVRSAEAKIRSAIYVREILRQLQKLRELREEANETASQLAHLLGQ